MVYIGTYNPDAHDHIFLPLIHRPPNLKTNVRIVFQFTEYTYVYTNV